MWKSWGNFGPFPIPDNYMQFHQYVVGELGRKRRLKKKEIWEKKNQKKSEKLIQSTKMEHRDEPLQKYYNFLANVRSGVNLKGKGPIFC